MDAEATTMRDGHPTGLSWYSAHSRPELKRPNTEPEWSKRLAAMLTQRGWPSTAECRYPVQGSRQKCDVVVTLPEGGTLWLEIKGAWKDYWLVRGNRRLYRSYLLHPFVPGLDKSKTHTAALDLQKLNAITRQQGTHIGLLLLGFDGAEPMQPDVDEFVRLARLHQPAWHSWRDSWPDERRPGQFIRCWLWIREIDR